MNRRYVLSLLAAALCLLAFAAACGQDGASSPGLLDQAVSSPAAAGSADVQTLALLVPTPTPEIRAGQPPREWSVAPSLDEQVFDSDTIVRATLLSASAGTESVPSDPGVAPTYRAVNEVRFTVHEYLKGSGPSEVVVVVRDEANYPGTVGTFVLEADALARAQAQLQQRKTTWDDREAVLFLRTGDPYRSGGASGGSQRTAQGNPAVEFTQSNPVAQTPFDYSIDTLSRAWLPSRDAGATGASRSADREYITDGSKSPPPTISLTDLRSKIAELRTTLEQGAAIEGFQECIRDKIGYERVERAYRDTVHATPSQVEATLASGSPAGTEFFRRKNNSSYWDTQYVRLWLSGPDMDRFQALIDDDDSDVSNGYDHALALARPLPAGEYRVTYDMQHEDYFPCNFLSPMPYGEWTVTVTSPVGALHEAFFDPVSVGAVVKADGTNGVLEPASFTDAKSAPATLKSISYEPPSGSGDGTVRLQIDPHTGLVGQALDFIELDGSVSLSLSVADATVDAASKTLSWSVASQPWDDGDKLMLRIRKAPPPAPQGLSVSLASGLFTITWSAAANAAGYRVQYRTGGAEGEWTNLDATTGTSQTFSPEGGVACGTTYEFRVQARGDGTTYAAEWGAPSESASHTTAACNRPPVFGSSSYSFSIAENAAVWDSVGIVTATDPDEGDSIAYYITAGNEAGRFNISSGDSGGLILVWGALDYEMVSSYTLTVEARDGKVGGTASATVEISVTDVDEGDPPAPGT